MSALQQRVKVCERELTTEPDSSWNPVLSEGFWSIAMDGIEVNGTIVSGTRVRAALDSGTT